MYIYPLPGTISSAISHSRRIDYADFLVARSCTASNTQLRDSRLANFAVGCFCTHRDHRAVHLVRKRKEERRKEEETHSPTKHKNKKIFTRYLKNRLKNLKFFKCYIYMMLNKCKEISSHIISYITGLYRNRRDGC